jgi:hypothetical protein
MNDDFVAKWKEAVVARFNVRSLHLLGGTEETIKILRTAGV